MKPPSEQGAMADAQAPSAAPSGSEHGLPEGGAEGPSGLSAVAEEKEDEEDNVLPPELSDVKPLTDDEFESIGKRIRSCAEERDVEGLESLIAAALWADGSRDQRFGLVQRELITTLMEQLESTSSTELKDHLGHFGRRLLHPIFRMGASPDLDRIRFHRGKAGAPCVLILGFGGSRLAELRAQEDFYRSWGFSTVLGTLVTYPRRMAQRQWARVARGLRDALDPAEPRLLIHACSAHGTSYLDSVTRLWTQGSPPFHELPALHGCLRGVIWECVTPILLQADLSLLEDLSIARGADEASRERFAEHLSELAAQGHGPEWVRASSNVVDKVAAAFMPEWGGRSILGKHKMMSLLLRSICPLYDPPAEGDCDYGGSLSMWAPCMKHWTALEVQMFDQKANIPRMFLYSTADKLFSSEHVEQSIDQQWHLFKGRKVTILVERCSKSLHMELWRTERSTCEKAVGKFLKVAKLKRF